jgi:hypothetical protein
MPVQDDVAYFREIAKHARKLAEHVKDAEAVAGLLRYAEAQEVKARKFDAMPILPPAAALPSGEPPIAEQGRP